MRFNQKTREYFREFIENLKNTKAFKDANYARAMGAVEAKLEFIALGIDTDTDFEILNRG